VTATPRTRIVVVGAGFMGSLHATTVAQSPTAALTGIVDNDRATGRQRAATLDVGYFPSVEAAIDADVADAFVVALPDRAHVATSVALLEAGYPILVEKPLADTLEGARAIAAAAAAGTGRVLVGHILRFDPRYVEAAATVANGEIGDLLHIRAGRFATRDIGVRMAGTSSVCFYLGIHDVDAVQWISGSAITEVSSVAVAKQLPARGIDSEDAILSVLRLESGAVGQLFNGWTRCEDGPVQIDGRLEAFGTAGTVEIDVRDHGLRLSTTAGYRTPDGLHWPTVNGLIVGDLAAEIAHFAHAVSTGAPFVVPLDAAVRAVAVNDAILRSVASGRAEAVVPVDALEPQGAQ
jgi:predicted dehydrogenase